MLSADSVYVEMSEYFDNEALYVAGEGICGSLESIVCDMGSAANAHYIIGGGLVQLEENIVHASPRSPTKVGVGVVCTEPNNSVQQVKSTQTSTELPNEDV